VVGFDDLLIILGVKSGIQREGRATQVDAYVMGEVHQRRQGFRQNDGILLIDRFHGNRADHKAVVFHDGQFFVTFLVLMTGVTDAGAPFFTTVLEPSP